MGRIKRKIGNIKVKDAKQVEGNEPNTPFEQFKDNYSKLSKKVERVTETLGIKKAMKFIGIEECGCDDRAVFLDRAYRGANCFTEDEYNYLSKQLPRLERLSVIPRKEGDEIIKIHDRVFNVKRTSTSCTSCSFKTIFKKLNNFYKKYNA